MITARKIALVLGGTGAIGTYLCEILSQDGWSVFVTTRSSRRSDDSNIEYIKGNAHDPSFLEELLSQKDWDVVVDFMSWSTDELKRVLNSLLSHSKQYVFLSSYRVYNDSPVLTEDCPRLLDSCCDEEYLETEEYALAKARQENLIFESGGSNWTIVRPTITFSRSRFQLCTYEVDMWMPMVLEGHMLPLPTEMLSRKTTMTWGCDAAMMLSRLLADGRTLGQVFNLCTSESIQWSDVLETYRKYLPIGVVGVDLSLFESTYNGYQSRYDRMFNRVMDNSKILKMTGIQQSDLAGSLDALAKEFSGYIDAPHFKNIHFRALGRLDALSHEHFNPLAFYEYYQPERMDYLKYLFGRYFD